MYLSDAIRLGAMMKPQGGVFTGSRHCSKTCAFGAALDAEGSDASVTDIWPWLYRLEVLVCPQCQESDMGAVWNRAIIPHLNNYCGWTRERIADWVEQQEYALGVRPQPEVVEPETVDEPVMEPEAVR